MRAERCKWVRGFRGALWWLPAGYCGIGGHGPRGDTCDWHDLRQLTEGRRLRWMRGATTEPLTHLPPPDPARLPGLWHAGIERAECGSRSRKLTRWIPEVECKRCKATPQWQSDCIRAGWTPMREAEHQRAKELAAVPPLRLVDED